MRFLVSLVLFVVLALTGYLGTHYWQSLQEAQLLNEGRACDLGVQDCAHPLPGGGSLTVSISPHPVLPMKPITVSIRVSGPSVIPQDMVLTGINMNMGVNRVHLKAVDDNVWSGETIIPICSRRLMQWQAALVLRENGDLYQVNDTFYIIRP